MLKPNLIAYGQESAWAALTGFMQAVKQIRVVSAGVEQAVGRVGHAADPVFVDIEADALALWISQRRAQQLRFGRGKDVLNKSSPDA